MNRTALVIHAAAIALLAIPNGIGRVPRGPVAIVADTATSDFESTGYIILRKNSATDVVAANLYLLGGVQQLAPQTQGIEALLLAVSGRGSRRFPGPMLRQEVARLGSEITISATEDFSTYGLKAIRSTFDSTWALYADRC